MKTRCRAAALSSMVLISATAGCSSTATPDYSQAYQQGRYQEAHAAAAAAARHSTGAERARAQLVQGMAAYAEEDYAEAMLRLAPLASSADDEIAGTAGATVGLIELDRGRYAQAAEALTRAAGRLDGDDAARARAHAARAYDLLGDKNAAARQRRLALGSASAPLEIPSSVAHRDGAYAIQLGAFSNRARAAKLAEMSRPLARSHGLSDPRVLLGRTSGGAVLYLVQVGRFSTKSEAVRAQRGLNTTSVIAGVPVE